VELGIVNKSGAFFKYNEKLLGQGRHAAIIFLDENPKVTEEIVKKVWEQVNSGKTAVPREIGEDHEE
ncbi:MAG: DNA recombination/repair protein RecA, partial [bacterium]|nr:DNA recombination/repair protein RecA [bacterium]